MSFLLILIALVAFCFLIWAWNVHPKGKVAKIGSKIDVLEKIKLENEYRRTATQAAGSIIVALGIVVAFVQLQEAHESAQRATESANRVQAMQAFNQGFALLGKPSSAERIGGIYTLESTMDALPERKKVILDALLTFVRSKPLDIGSGKCEEIHDRKPEDELVIAPEIQIALDVIVRYAKGTLTDIDLSRTNLKQASLKGAVDLRGVNVNFAYSDLSGANLAATKFGKLDLYCTNLYNADLSGSIIESAQATMAKMWDANLNGSHLERAVFYRALFGGATLCGIYLNNADLIEADISNSVVEGADFKDAKAAGTKFYGAKGKPKSSDFDTKEGAPTFVPPFLPLADKSECDRSRARSAR